MSTPLGPPIGMGGGTPSVPPTGRGEANAARFKVFCVGGGIDERLSTDRLARATLR